jgi:hypothetical protein
MNAREIPMSSNPYAVQTTDYMTSPAAGDAESVRRMYLNHEASVKSIGTLYYLGGFFGLLAGVFYLGIGVVAVTAGMPGQQGGEQERMILAITMWVFGLFVLVMSGVQLWTAYGLRRLRPYSRIAGSVIAGIGLLGFPIGTLIGGYALYLLLSAKGEFIFSPQYRAVIEQTPHIKYKSSIIVRILVGILLFFLLLALFGGILSVVGR